MLQAGAIGDFAKPAFIAGGLYATLSRLFTSTTKGDLNLHAIQPIRRERLKMDDALQTLLDSGWLFLAFGAVICIFLGIGPVRRLFQGAKRAEPPDLGR
jgi:hypothetical protein